MQKKFKIGKNEHLIVIFHCNLKCNEECRLVYVLASLLDTHDKLVILHQWWRSNIEQKTYQAQKTFTNVRSSHPEVFLGKDVLKTCSKFTGDHPCRSTISIY